jgi:bifunctional non-homologous end joining protein LigD
VRQQASLFGAFVPASRRDVFEKLRGLASPTCPFVNLPEKHSSRWGDALTADKMKKCVWLRPEHVAQVEFLEWTSGDRLRHERFVGLREDKEAREVVKERAGVS